MAVLSINKQKMPSPSKLYVVLSDISSRAERNAAGQTIVDRIAIKRRLECDWPYMTRHELADLLERTDPVFFEVEYFDPYEDDMKTIICYAGERSTGTLMYKNHLPVWGPVKITFFER